MRLEYTTALGKLYIALIYISLLTGCGGNTYHSQTPPPPVQTEALSFSRAIKEGLDVIRVGDQLSISFTDIKEPIEIKPVRVREDGTIVLPFNQTVVAAGKTVSELEKEIYDRYVPKFYKQMTVRIEVYERTFTVGGEVRNPGRYPYIGQMTVLQAIRVAGDFTVFANQRKVQVTRRDGTTVIIDCKKALKEPEYDIPIYPGDAVYVPRSIF